ncbi:MAG: hypothetical protein ABGY75_19140 [Gemmataceae bacterium]
MRNFMMPNFYFTHIPSGRSWPTDDPHQWLLNHREDDLLAPARERLVLSHDDPERYLRVALRRCGLALIRITTDSQIALHYWSGPNPDMRGWAKAYGWNRPGVQVVFVQEKTGRAVVYEDGQVVLMYGEPVGPDFPWDVYEAMYARRLAEERDDFVTASASVTNFEWENCPNGRLTWRVLKSIWTTERVTCSNCDVPLILTAFRWKRGMLSFRSGRTVRYCPRCRRRFEADVDRPLEWLTSVLPAHLRPTHLRLWTAISINWLELSLRRDRPVQLADAERS